MAFANFNTQEINCKIVYFGAPGSGKTTNLKELLEATSAQPKPGALTLEPVGPTQGPAFFEFLPIRIGNLSDHRLKVHLYTMPPDHMYSSFLSVLLKGMDGFVFVVDSCLDRLPHNLQAWGNTKDLILKEGGVMTQLPAVIQYNKRDQPSALPIKVLNQAINTLGLPAIEASAHQGLGVMESLHMVVEQLARQLASPGKHLNT